MQFHQYRAKSARDPEGIRNAAEHYSVGALVGMVLLLALVLWAMGFLRNMGS